MKKIKLALIILLALLPIVVTTVAVLRMPDTVAVHFNVHGQVDRYGSKYEVLPLPVIILGVALFFLVIRKIAKIASADDKTACNFDVLDTAILLILVFFNVLCVFILAVMGNPSVMQSSSLLFIIICSAMGILFILLGNIMPKTKRNAFIGMRLKFAMDTDEHWYIANRAGGIAMVLAGLATVVAGLIFRNLTSVFMMIVSLIVFLMVASIYSYVIIKRENKI